MSKCFELPAEANIYNIMETRESLLAWVAEQNLRSHGPLEISARDVAEIDGAGLQLLASLGSTAPGWRLVDASPIFLDACRTLGFDAWLDLRYLKAADSSANARETT
jgi:hypothetical protein